MTSTNKENQQARQSRQKPTRHQRMHATYGTSTDISWICLIQEYVGGTEISVAAVTQEKTHRMTTQMARNKKVEKFVWRKQETTQHGTNSWKVA
jgi:hypothetical protein